MPPTRNVCFQWCEIHNGIGMIDFTRSVIALRGHITANKYESVLLDQVCTVAHTHFPDDGFPIFLNNNATVRTSTVIQEFIVIHSLKPSYFHGLLNHQI